MAVSSEAIGWSIWGTCCFCAFCYLVIYDGYFKKNSQVISNIYGVYLFCSFLVSMLIVADYEANTGDSYVLYYSRLILLGIAACTYIVLALLWILSPLKYRVDILIKFGIPILFVLFVIGLFVVPTESAVYILAALYTPSSIFVYISLFTMYYWFKNEKYIFKDIPDRKRVNVYLLMTLFGGTMGLINFIYPRLASSGYVPDDYATLWTRVSDSIFYVPFIIPMVRYLNEMEWYSRQNVMRMMKGEMDNAANSEEKVTAEMTNTI